jgi:hypothetical protein
MANISKPCGLKPVGYLDGSPWNGQARKYFATAPAAGLFVGDPVTLSGTGDAQGIPGAVIGVAGSAIIGVVVGVLPTQAGVSQVATTLDLTSRSLAANATGYILVADDPAILFEIQDGMTSTFAQVTDIGQNTNFLIAAGTNVYSDSGTTTATTVTGTTTANLKILGFSQREDNTPGTQYAKLLVKINNHVFVGTGTAAI